MWSFFSSAVCFLVIILSNAKYTHGKNILLLPDLEPFQHFRVFEDIADGLQAQGHTVYLFLPFMKEPWVGNDYLKEFDSKEWKTFKVRQEHAWYQYVLQKTFNGGLDVASDLEHGIQQTSCEDHTLKNVFATFKDKKIDLAILAGFYENIQYVTMLDKLDIPYITIANKEPEQMLDPRNRVDENEKCLFSPGGQGLGLMEGAGTFINKIYCLFFKSVIYPGSASKYCPEDRHHSYIHHLVEKSQLWILDFQKNLGNSGSLAPPMAELENLRTYEISPIVHDIMNNLLGPPNKNMVVVEFCETKFDRNSEIIQHITKVFEDFVIIWYQDIVPERKSPNQVYFKTDVPLPVLLSHPKTSFFISDGSNNINPNDFVTDIPIWLVPQTAKQHYNAYDIVTRVQGTILHNVTSEKLANQLQEHISKNPNKEQLSVSEKDKKSTAKDIKKLIHWIEHILYFGNVVFHQDVAQLQSQEKSEGILHEIFITLAVVFSLLFLATCVFLLGIIQGSRKRNAQQLPFQRTVSPSNEILESNGMLEDLKKLKEEFLSNIQKEAQDATRQFTEDIQRRSSVSSQRSNPIPDALLNHENEFSCISRKFTLTPNGKIQGGNENEYSTSSLKIIKNGDGMKMFQRNKSFDLEKPIDVSVLKLGLKDEEKGSQVEKRETPIGITMSHKTPDKLSPRDDLEMILDPNAKKVKDLIPLYSEGLQDTENKEREIESLKQLDPAQGMKSLNNAKESPVKDEMGQYDVKIENLISSLKNSVLQSGVRKSNHDDTVTPPSDQSVDQNTSISEMSGDIESDSMPEADRKRVKDLIPLYCEVSIDNEQNEHPHTSKVNAGHLKDSFAKNGKTEPLSSNNRNQEDTTTTQVAPSDDVILDQTSVDKDSTNSSHISLTLENETKRVKDLIPLYDEDPLEREKTMKSPDIQVCKNTDFPKDSDNNKLIFEGSFFEPCAVSTEKGGSQDNIAIYPNEQISCAMDFFENKSKELNGHENGTHWLEKKEKKISEKEFTFSAEKEKLNKQNGNHVQLDTFKTNDDMQHKTPVNVESQDDKLITDRKTNTYSHYSSRYFAGTRTRSPLHKEDQKQRCNDVKTKTVDKNEEDLSREWFVSEVKKDNQWDSKGVPISLKLYKVQPYQYEDSKSRQKQTIGSDLVTKTYNGSQENSGPLMPKQRQDSNFDLKTYNAGQPDMTLTKPNKEKFQECRNNFREQYLLKNPKVQSNYSEKNQKWPPVYKDDSKKNEWIQDNRELANTKSNEQKRMIPFAYYGTHDTEYKKQEHLNRCLSQEIITSNGNENITAEKKSHSSRQQNDHIPLTNTREFVETVQYPYLNAWINMDETTAVTSIQEKEASREMLEKLQRISVSKEVRNIEAKQVQQKKEIHNPNETVPQEKKTMVWDRLKEKISRKYEAEETFIKKEERRASFNSLDRKYDRKKADYQSEDDFQTIRRRSSERSGHLSEGETQYRRGNVRRRKSWFSDEESRSIKKKENPQTHSGRGDVRNGNGCQGDIQRREDDTNLMISNGDDPYNKDTYHKTRMGTSAIEATRRKRIPSRRPRSLNVFSSDDDLDRPNTSTQDMVTSIWLSTINKKDGDQEPCKQKQTETKKKPEPRPWSFHCENGRQEDGGTTNDEPIRTGMGVKEMAKYWQENNGGSLPRINANSRSNTFPRAQKQKTYNEIKRSSSRTEMRPANSRANSPKETNGVTDNKDMDIQDGSIRRKRPSKKASVHAMLADILNRRKQPKDTENKINSRPSDSTKGSPTSIKSIRSGGNVLEKVSAFLGKPRTPRTPRSFLARKNKIRHSKGSPHHTRKPLNGKEDEEKSMSPSPKQSIPPPPPLPPPPPPPLPPSSFGTKPKPTPLKSLSDVIKHSCLKKAFQPYQEDQIDSSETFHTQKTLHNKNCTKDKTEGNEFMDELTKRLEARRANDYETD